MWYAEKSGVREWGVRVGSRAFSPPLSQSRVRVTELVLYNYHVVDGHLVGLT